MVDRAALPLSASLLVNLFLGACQAKTLGEEEYTEARADLDCEVLLACGEVSNESECPTEFGRSGPCSRYSPEGAQQCVEALELLLDEVEADASVCPDPFLVRECEGVFVASNAPECGPTVGRPLFVDGEQRLAPLLRWSPPDAACETRKRAARRWLEYARGEAASVPAFERLHEELLRNGAPSALLAECRDARRDEVEHTRLCLALVAQLSGAEPELGAMPGITARSAADLERLAIEALLEGAIDEGSAAAWAAAAAPKADPAFAQVLRRIAADELRHATLSWRILAWALERQPDLGPVLCEALDRWKPRAATSDLRAGLARFGVLDVGQERAIKQTLVETVVRPTLETLCARYCAARSNSVPSVGC